MALVTVDGEVSRINRSGNGFGVKEQRSGSTGQTFTTYWSVFPKGPEEVQVGDRVRVSGFLRTSVTDPKPDSDKRYVDHLVSNARVQPQAGVGRDETHSGGTGEGSGVPEPQGDVWGNGTYDETPF